ncbi:hypothetical protein C1H46_026009 [Malus baccata]|uniref:Uncharacterized protein n=1 Tax=Malus baccata TaxID=106549 RepID=A0A540LPK7_MALBA|nr:hypothetical protein C1H46_026009 [Malus baccata]
MHGIYVSIVIRVVKIVKGMDKQHLSNRLSRLLLPHHSSDPAFQLIASEIFPVTAVKALLYPGAVANGLAKNMTVPSWNNLLEVYNLTSAKEASPGFFYADDLHLGSIFILNYFAVAGALVGILKRGRMNMFGMLLVLWGLIKEGILGKPVNTDPTKAVFVYPTMLIAVIAAFSSVKYNMKKAAARSAPAARPIAKPLQRSSKSKLK